MSPPLTQRKRAFLPKVKTGCQICKARKIKCDQAKPSCRRCTSSNRICSYQTTPTPSPERQVGHSMSAWLGSGSEKRSFDFFLTRASQRMGGYFNDVFWSREVLQAAIGYPSIRHLVVALGAAYEQFEVRNPSPSSLGRCEDMRFALEQCNHSIRNLAASTPESTEEMCCILTASVLFASFASLQSHMPEAIEHVRSGMRVLRNLDALGVSTAFPVPVSRLRSILTSLYAQARSMINDEARFDWGGYDPLVSDIAPVEYFWDLADAQSYVEVLFGNTLAHFQRIELFPSINSKEIHVQTAQEQRLRESLLSSCAALDALVARQTGVLDDKGIAVLRLYHNLLTIRLGLDHKVSRESSFDDFEEQLVQMLDYCRTILRDDEPNSADKQSAPRVLYSAGLGIVMPLHMVAARCRNSAVRKEAVELLSRAQRRDWLWDSTVVEKIVTTTIELERDGSLIELQNAGYLVDESCCDVQKVTENARIREVKVQFEGERSARLVFVTVGHWRNEEQGYVRFIKW